jgi:hypothetical protein
MLALAKIVLELWVSTLLTLMDNLLPQQKMAANRDSQQTTIVMLLCLRKRGVNLPEASQAMPQHRAVL